MSQFLFPSEQRWRLSFRLFRYVLFPFRFRFRFRFLLILQSGWPGRSVLFYISQFEILPELYFFSKKGDSWNVILGGRRKRMKLLKNRKPFDLCSSNLGTRFCICKIIWALVGLILIFHVHSIIIYKSNINSKVSVSVTIGDKELKVVEEEPMFMLPPRRKHSPHAVKRIGGRVKKHQHQHPTVIDEFLDESSKLRPFFFPDRRPPNDTLYYYPGERWVDTDGNLIQAHGGGVLVVENTYYWYGENKDGRTYHAHSKSLARVS